jgi:YegS/Rv2252/BmrU family lipid kinase
VAARLRVAVVINPVSGVRATLERARRKAELASDLLLAAQADPDVLITAHAGHARELAASAAARGARIVVAWGGDGTVNEVAAGVIGSAASLAVIPAGSGNGLARTLGMPADPARALRRCLDGADRLIDVGEIDGRLFVNVAGIGFDAHIAAAFAALGQGRRGFLRYASIVLRELWAYQGPACTLALEPVAGERPTTAHPARPFLLSFANGRQWGNGAIVAPDARLDDGALDAVVVEDRGRLAVLRAIPRLFRGTIARAPGVTITRMTAALVTGPGPFVYHADGEACVGGPTVRVSVRPGALRVRA